MPTFTRFYAAQVAALVDKLASTSDASGRSLLESTLVVWASELGGDEKNEDAHLTGSLPVVLFSSDPAFRTARYIRGKSGDGRSGWVEAGRDMARLLVSAVHYMGLRDIRTVGATGVEGPLATLQG